MFEERPAWQADALCNTGDAALVDVFFGRGRRDFDGERAKQICASCPVQFECLDYALTYADTPDGPGATTPATGQGGVWGGLTHHERLDLHREQQSA
jgi:hypothetical protein